MSKLFNHTVQPLGSTTSPVEDLALEIEDAFTSIEKTVDVSNTVINNFGDTIGNPVFEDLEGHGVNKSVSEVHNMLSDESNIVLKDIPNQGTLTLSYTDPNTGTIISLREIPYDQDFTDKNQFKYSGKLVTLNIRVPSNSSVAINTTYATKTFTLGGEKFLSNVISKEDGTFALQPVKLGTNSYSLVYGISIKNNPEKHFDKSLSFFVKEEGSEEYKKLQVTDYTYEDDSLTFNTNDLPDDLSSVKVLAFAQNTSISALLNALYKEFREHSHSKGEMTSNIEASELANRFVNTDKINYKDDNIDNYLFPQYFNREGYNPDLDAVYENSILGDVFISRVISDTVQKFKGLDADSNALIFADPVRGHKLKYSRQDEALVLNTVMPMNGLRVLVNDEEKYGLGINDSKLRSNSTGLRVEPQQNTFNVKSEKDDEKYTSNFDKIVADESELEKVKAGTININDVSITEHEDGSSLEFTSKNKDKKVIFSTPVEAKTVIIDRLVSPNEVSFKALGTNWAKFGDISFKVNEDNDLVVTDEGDPKDNKIIYKLPTKYDGRITANHISPTTINFGNIVYTVDDNTLGLNIFSTVPDQSFVTFQNLTKFTSGLEYSLGKGDIQIGDITFKDDADSNYIIVESGKEETELLFKNKVVFKHLTTEQDSKVNIYSANFDKAFFGGVVLEKTSDDLAINHTDPSHPIGTLKVNVPTNLENVTYNRLTGPTGSTATMDSLEVSNLTIGGVVISTNGVLTGNVGNTQPGQQPPTPVPTPGATASPSVPGATLSFAAKLEANELSAKQATIDLLNINAADAKALKIGHGLFSPDTDLNTTLTSTVDKAKFKVSMDSEFKNLLASSLTASSLISTEGTLEKVNIGQVSISTTDDDVTVSRSDSTAVFKLNLPVEAQDFTAVNFSTTNDATMKNIFGTTITVNGIKWSSDDEGNSTFSTEDTDKRINFNLPVYFSNSRSKLNGSEDYKLLPDDKISINADNYISNHNGKFIAKMSKGYSYVGSGKDTGIKFILEEDSLPSMQQYVASNVGGVAGETEKNAFVEIDVNDGLYLLQSTSKKIQHKGTIYGFNDPSAQQNISDLRRWVRAPLFSGPIEAERINLAMVDSSDRNGISIGETRISVIGPNTDCPTGLTTFESGEGIHFVAPLAKDNTCRNLTYQEVNVGPLAVKGDISAENSMTVTEDLMVGGTASAGFLDITQEASVNSIKISDTLTVTGKAEFKNSLDVANTITAAGAIQTKGDFEGQNVRVARDAEIQRDLRVANDTYISGDTVIEGSLSIAKGFQTSGVVKTVGLEVEDFKSHRGEILTNFKVAGEQVIGGKLSVEASTTIGGNAYIKSRLEVDEDIVAKNLYSIKDTTVRGNFDVLGNTELSGNVINIGSDGTKTQINGKLTINTDVLSVNSPTRIFNTLKVSEGAEFASQVHAKAGMMVDAGIQAKGVISTESNVEVGASLSAKTAEIAQDVRVGSSLVANSLTADSLVIEQRASINNLTISGSLSMPTDTTIVVGDVKANSFTQTNANMMSTFAGTLYVGKKLEVANDLKVSGAIVFDSGELQITSLGMKGKDAVIDINKVRADVITGNSRIQPPPELAMSGNPSAMTLSNIISTATNYVRLENSLFEGITVFAQPVVAGTVYYTDLVQIKETQGSNRSNSVDLTARRALYA